MNFTIAIKIRCFFIYFYYYYESQKVIQAKYMTLGTLSYIHGTVNLPGIPGTPGRPSAPLSPGGPITPCGPTIPVGESPKHNFNISVLMN